MEGQRQEAREETARLRCCLNDLVSIMALPALWAGAGPQQIAGTLLARLSECSNSRLRSFGSMIRTADLR
jgi:hypothetical protein